MTEQVAPAAEAAPEVQAPEAHSEPVEQTNVEETATEGAATGESSSETTAEFKEAVEEAIEDGATEEEVKEMIKEFELKVNGKKKKIKLDLNNEEEIKRQLQLAAAGQSAMQQKAEMEKMLQQAVAEWRQNPDAFFQEFGVDPDDWAEQRIAKKVEELQKSPEQLEHEKLVRELEKARNELKRQETEAKEIKMQQLQAQASAELESEIMDALDKNPNLPRTRKTVTRIADAMVWAIENGYENVVVEDVVPAVEAEIRAEFNEFMSELPEEVMESYIGKKNLERLRKKRLAAAKKAKSIEKIEEVSKPVNKKEEYNALNPKKKNVKASDFFRNLK